MNSPFATLLIQLQERITQEVPEIKWIDQDLGQLEYFQMRPSVDWPCVLIDFEDFSFEDLGEAIQMATGHVLLRLAFPPYSQTSNGTPTKWKEKALSFYDIEYKLQKALHSWQPENYGYMLRVNVQTEKRDDDIRVRDLRYSISFEDYISEPEYTKVLRPDLNITT